MKRTNPNHPQFHETVEEAIESWDKFLPINEGDPETPDYILVNRRDRSEILFLEFHENTNLYHFNGWPVLLTGHTLLNMDEIHHWEACRYG